MHLGNFLREQRLHLVPQKRQNTPSMLARRPRYSLVWKLLFVPRDPRPDAPETICRPEWGPPAVIGARRAAPAPAPPSKRARTASASDAQT